MVPVSKEDGDLASQYNSFLETEEINDVSELKEHDITFHQNGKLVKPVRLDNDSILSVRALDLIAWFWIASLAYDMVPIYSGLKQTTQRRANCRDGKCCPSRGTG